MNFPTRYDEILQKVAAVNPIAYGKSRNYLNGAVTRLSPYLARGVLSTRQVAQAVLGEGYNPFDITSFIQELAWRDYFQQVWKTRGSEIDTDLKQPQQGVINYAISSAILNGKTGIEALDDGVQELYDTGYIHNHLRMYIASVACNIAGSHWKTPARWMYYHLLDADWASNGLSWQWVAGSFSAKKYFANQENINRYCDTRQRGTFLDVAYGDFEELTVPPVLQQHEEIALKTQLSQTTTPTLQPHLPTYVYNFYNLDPAWESHVEANRILLLESAFFERYPVCSRTVDFVLALAENIPGIQVWTASFDELHSLAKGGEIHFKEHPANAHYHGTEHERDWLFPTIQGYFPSFFSFWKKGSKNLKALVPHKP